MRIYDELRRKIADCESITEFVSLIYAAEREAYVMAGMVHNSTVNPGLDFHRGNNGLTYAVVHSVVSLHPQVVSDIFLKFW